MKPNVVALKPVSITNIFKKPKRLLGFSEWLALVWNPKKQAGKTC